MRNYIDTQMMETQQLITTMMSDNTLISTLEACTKTCIECLTKGGKILLAGNGGSAAQAQHFAAELVNRFAIDRRGLSAIALTTDTSILTAIGNDCGYEHLFGRQVQAHGKFGDLFIGYSTSGQSLNILRAFKEAQELGMVCIGMTGNREGAIQTCCDFLLEIPSNNTAKIQEGHLILGHILCDLIEQALFKVLG